MKQKRPFVSVGLKREIYDRFSTYCEDNFMSRRLLFTKIVTDYLEKNQNNNQ